MYLTRLTSWTENNWEEFFSSYNLSDVQKMTVRSILEDEKGSIEKHFRYLRSLGIINGVGPGYFASFFRAFITFLFGVVRYEWHDIEYAIGGSKEDRKRVDKGLLKYSFLSIRENLHIILDMKTGPVSKGLQLTVFLITLPLSISAIYFCYLMVRVGGRYAFRYYS